MLQHTPLAVTLIPPSEVTFPPAFTLLVVTLLIGEVDTSGNEEQSGVVKVS